MRRTTREEAQKQWEDRLDEVRCFAANGAPPINQQQHLDLAEAKVESHPQEADELYRQVAISFGVGDVEALRAMHEELGLHPACLMVLRIWTERMPWKPGDHHSHLLLTEAMFELLPLFELFARRTGLIRSIEKFAEELHKRRAEVHNPKLNLSSTYAELRGLARRMDEGFTRARELGWLLPERLRDKQ